MTPRPLGGARWSSLLLAATAGLVLFGAGACAPQDDELTVFAAASLRTVVDELVVAWFSEYPDATVQVGTDGSHVLAAQIAEGAPADVFISADTVRPQQLAEAGLTADQPVPFASNLVTLVVPAASDRLADPLDVAGPGVRLVGVNEGAPIARYTDRAIAELAEMTPAAEVFVAAVEANLASREDNVAAALAKVALGEGDAAFVYHTDALSSDQVRELPLPGDAAVRATYSAVRITEEPLAAAFLDWLDGPAARAIIEAAGFEAAP